MHSFDCIYFCIASSLQHKHDRPQATTWVCFFNEQTEPYECNQDPPVLQLSYRELRPGMFRVNFLFASLVLNKVCKVWVGMNAELLAGGSHYDSVVGLKVCAF